MRKHCLYISVIAILIASLCSPAGAWDSADWKNPTRPTHSLMTKYAINELNASYPEVGKYKDQLIEGANCEIHELKINSAKYIKKYGLDMEDKRKNRYLGTNAGCLRPDLIWQDARAAYLAGKKDAAFFLMGVLLHQIQDMSVPSHAHNLYHQGNLTEFDNFELMALLNWKPDFAGIKVTDPAFLDPSAYYEFSRKWCLEDAPDYTSCSKFSKTWITASKADRKLLSKRQASACLLTKWALESALVAFAKPESPPTSPSTP
jgi:hypothetical protein